MPTFNLPDNAKLLFKGTCQFTFPLTVGESCVMLCPILVLSGLLKIGFLDSLVRSVK